MIKADKVPERFENNPNVKRQKDLDARWTKKNKETHYGYKNHACVDNKHKLIRDYGVTSAEVHDSPVFHDLLGGNTSKDVRADSAYYSEGSEFMLEAMGYQSHAHSKGYRGRPLSEQQKQANRTKLKIRARVEHAFDSIENEEGGSFICVIGQARTTIKIGVMDLVYNFCRLVSACPGG